MNLRLLKNLDFGRKLNEQEAVTEAGRECLKKYRGYVYTNPVSCGIVNAFVNEASQYRFDNNLMSIVESVLSYITENNISWKLASACESIGSRNSQYDYIAKNAVGQVEKLLEMNEKDVISYIKAGALKNIQYVTEFRNVCKEVYGKQVNEMRTMQYEVTTPVSYIYVNENNDTMFNVLGTTYSRRADGTVVESFTDNTKFNRINKILGAFKLVDEALVYEYQYSLNSPALKIMISEGQPAPANNSSQTQGQQAQQSGSQPQQGGQSGQAPKPEELKGKQVMSPDGKNPVGKVGDDGKQVMGPDGKTPVGTVGPDGKQVMGPDGKTVVGQISDQPADKAGSQPQQGQQQNQQNSSSGSTPVTPQNSSLDPHIYFSRGNVNKVFDSVVEFRQYADNLSAVLFGQEKMDLLNIVGCTAEVFEAYDNIVSVDWAKIVNSANGSACVVIEGKDNVSLTVLKSRNNVQQFTEDYTYMVEALKRVEKLTGVSLNALYEERIDNDLKKEKPEEYNKIKKELEDTKDAQKKARQEKIEKLAEAHKNNPAIIALLNKTAKELSLLN